MIAAQVGDLRVHAAEVGVDLRAAWTGETHTEDALLPHESVSAILKVITEHQTIRQKSATAH